MRSVERLIRQLANARISEVQGEQRSGLQKVRDDFKMSELPKAVRAAFDRLKKLEAEEQALKAVIEKAGFRSYRYGSDTAYRNDADKERTAINKRAQDRIAAVEALRSKALIDTIGTTPEEAKQALVEFRGAILKV